MIENGFHNFNYQKIMKFVLKAKAKKIVKDLLTASNMALTAAFESAASRIQWRTIQAVRITLGFSYSSLEPPVAATQMKQTNGHV